MLLSTQQSLKSCASFLPHTRETQKESWKCMKYEGGLRADILALMALLEIRSYVTLVNKSHIVEDCNGKLAFQRLEAHKRKQVTQGQ